MVQLKIKIVELPAGSPPEWVRKASLGLVLECVDSRRHISALIGLAAGIPAAENTEGYQVYMRDLMRALRESGHIAAANWWQYDSGWPPETVLQYGAMFCEVVE